MKKIVSLLVTFVMVSMLGTAIVSAIDAGPTIVPYVPHGITTSALDFIPEKSNHHSLSLDEKTVAIDAERYYFTYNVTTEDSYYDLYLFYSTRAPIFYLTLSVDGEAEQVYTLPESMGWTKGTSYIKLTTLDLSEGDHTIKFGFRNPPSTNILYLENFTLVKVDEAGNVIYGVDDSGDYEPMFVDEIPNGIEIDATKFNRATSDYADWAVRTKAVTVTRDSSKYDYDVEIPQDGIYDMYVFYSSRAGSAHLKFSLDGEFVKTFIVPEAKGWAYGVANIKLKALDLNAGKHVLTFASDYGNTYNYYFLETIALVPRDEALDNNEDNFFDDVNSSDWFYDSVKTAFEKEIMNGTTETLFAPNDNVTRAMFVTVLHRMSGNEEEITEIPFVDVAKDSYYAKAVAWAKKYEIIGGVSENEFAPDNIITREQMCAMMQRFAKYKELDAEEGDAGDLAFIDSSEISEYAAEAIKWAVDAEIMKGNPDGSFAPKSHATRAEAATVLVRVLNLNK